MFREVDASEKLVKCSFKESFCERDIEVRWESSFPEDLMIVLYKT